jgi:hypothetical protein
MRFGGCRMSALSGAAGGLGQTAHGPGVLAVCWLEEVIELATAKLSGDTCRTRGGGSSRKPEAGCARTADLAGEQGSTGSETRGTRNNIFGPYFPAARGTSPDLRQPIL